ncbi:GUN4 domain-containing protein [Nostoc sp. UIC 10630]|uniref:GUN4 domain-containing protein n=1 Tax=Nostoc sp. UIC 10630 TaxID=2100146 RepID=UPI0013D427E1|nr:GUN4 domain-containing protein [Nostoc sp. UIC 10630]NEU83720.1 NC domain/GUN4 [Nostoc sp. UIC 10630]
MGKGDHIYVERYYGFVPYTHHGIDCGDGKAIHYSGTDICKIPLKDFSQGQKVYVKQYNNSDVSDIVIMRAESRIGERNYHLVFNNCEHFANWCKIGKDESEQVIKPILDLLDFFNWRLQDQERQYYKNLIDKHNEILRKVSYPLNNEHQDISKILKDNAAFKQNSYQVAYQEQSDFLQLEENSLVTDKFDYTILQNLLENGFWQEADELTFYAMLKVVNRENDRYFRPVDISNFPYKDLLIIDKLWLTFSQELFGFSVQKAIYQRYGFVFIGCN